MNEIYEAAINKFGTSAQILKLVEECGELSAAGARVVNNSRDRRENFYEEIADVEIMLEQMRIICGDKNIDRYKEAKIKRLGERVGVCQDSLENPHAARNSRDYDSDRDRDSVAG